MRNRKNIYCLTILIVTINFLAIINYLQNNVTKILFLLMFSFLLMYIRQYYLFICYMSLWRGLDISKDTNLSIITYRPITINEKNKIALIKIISGCTKNYLVLRYINNVEFYKIYTSKVFISFKNFANELESINNIDVNGVNKKIFHIIMSNQILKYKNLVVSILLGVKNIDTSIKKIFLNTSTWHLLCIGGLHINIILNCFFIIEKILWEIIKRIYVIRKCFTIIRLFFLFFYLYIVEWHIPALRSLLTKILEIIFYLLKIPYRFFIGYTIIFMSFVIYDYNYLYNVGFQMSFLAVFFLYNFSWKGNNFFMYFIWQNFLLSVILSGFSFYLECKWNILGFLGNFFAIPLFYLIIISSWLGIIYTKFFYITNVLFYILIKILENFSYYGIYLYCFIPEKILNLVLFLFINVMVLIKIIYLRKN